MADVAARIIHSENSQDDKATLLASPTNTANNNDDDELPTESPTKGEPDLKISATFSPIPKTTELKTARRPVQNESESLTDPSPVKNIVSRFEKKKEQSLDALPFRTVRSFFEGDERRSIHVNLEKQKYDALMEKQRQEALLVRSPEQGASRKRVGSHGSGASASEVSERPSLESNNAEDEEAVATMAAEIGKAKKFVEEQIAEGVVQSNQDESAEVPETLEDEDEPPPPPPPALEADEEEEQEETKEHSQLMETPEQERKKRPILTTERSFVMEEDHTIETEDMIVVGERFSTDGEEDREEIMALLERELHLTPEDDRELRDALDSNLSPAPRGRMPKYNYKKPENVPSKLHLPTAASLAGRTTKSAASVKKEASAKPTPKPSSAVTPTRKSNRYANVQSKVKEMINSRPVSARKESDASDASFSMMSPVSAKSSASASGNGRHQGNGAASVDRRSFMSNRSSSRRSSNFRTLGDLHGEDAHSDWEGRHRTERLSFASSTSSTDSSDPFALQLSYSARKSRYDHVESRYLEYSKSSSYTRNKETQLERRKKLEEVNSVKSVDRQKQLQFQLKLKEKREKQDREDAVRRGEELHTFTKQVRDKEKQEYAERRLSQNATRRALNGTVLDTARRRPSLSSLGVSSSPRTSLISESDSIPSAASAPSVDAFAV